MVLETDGFKTALAETGLKQALIAKGINPTYIAEKIDLLLNAKDKTDRDHPDYTAIDKGLKHVTAIYGVVDPSQKPVEQRNTYNFIFAPQTQQKIREMDEELKSLLIKGHVVQENTQPVEPERVQASGDGSSSIGRHDGETDNS